MHPIVFLPLLMLIIIAISSCTAMKNTIIILESPKGKGFVMNFKEWSSTDKCELSLNAGDELQVEVACDTGKIALLIRGKNGTEPYMGNDLKNGKFTVTVSETDRYVFRIAGKKATGTIKVSR